MLKRTLVAAIAAGLYAHIVGAADRLAVSWNQGGSGRVALMQTQDPWRLNSPLTIDANPTLRYAQGRLYAVSRTARTVTVIDPGTWSIEGVFTLQNTGDLRDIALPAVSATTPVAYLTDAGSTAIIRLDLGTGATTRIIDTTVLPAACGHEMDRMAAYGTLLFVQLYSQQFEFDAPGCLAVVDLLTEQLVDAVPATLQVDPIVLQGRRPKMKMRIFPADPTLPDTPDNIDRLFVSASGKIHDLGGALEAVDPNTLVSSGRVLVEAGSDFRGFAILSAPWSATMGGEIHPTFVPKVTGFLSDSTTFPESEHLFKFHNGQITHYPYDVPGFVNPWLEHASGYVFLPDGGPNPPGIVVFGLNPGPPITKRLTGGEPTDIELVP